MQYPDHVILGPVKIKDGLFIGDEIASQVNLTITFITQRT